jgi:hypothetical protein
MNRIGMGSDCSLFFLDAALCLVSADVYWITPHVLLARAFSTSKICAEGAKKTGLVRCCLNP